MHHTIGAQGVKVEIKTPRMLHEQSGNKNIHEDLLSSPGDFLKIERSS
jgi:hypothetical protein